MTTSSPLFDISQLPADQQQKFEAAYKELEPHYLVYVQYKLNLELKTPMEKEEEDNEWRYQLHRFLRARKWNVPHTVQSIVEMIKWRMDHRIDTVLENQVAIDHIEALRKIVPSADHGHTKLGRPLYIEKSGLISVDKILGAFQPAELIQSHIYWLELHCQLTRERSRQLGKHVDSVAIIYDLHGCKIDMRKLLPLLKQSLHIDENYYPERLGQMFIVNPPMIFPTLWNLVKHWLDPVTKTKILVIKRGPEAVATLLQHIDSDQLPRELGGSCASCPTLSDCIPNYQQNKE